MRWRHPQQLALPLQFTHRLGMPGPGAQVVLLELVKPDVRERKQRLSLADMRAFIHEHRGHLGRGRAVISALLTGEVMTRPVSRTDPSILWYRGVTVVTCRGCHLGGISSSSVTISVSSGPAWRTRGNACARDRPRGHGRCIRLFRKVGPQAESIKAADTKRIVLMVL